MKRRRPPEEIRDEVDLSYKIVDQSIELFEVRPEFEGTGKIEIPIAKTTFIRKNNTWKIFLHRSDLKWHPYEPMNVVDSIQEFIRIVEEDSYCCFWG